MNVPSSYKDIFVEAYAYYVRYNRPAWPVKSVG